MSTLLETIQLDSAPNPTVSIIWMHGLGADGNDFVPLVKELDLRGCPAIRFIFPSAGTMPVTINNGYVMRAWYDIRENDLVRREDENGLRASQAQIEALFAREKARGIPASRISTPSARIRSRSGSSSTICSFTASFSVTTGVHCRSSRCSAASTPRRVYF